MNKFVAATVASVSALALFAGCQSSSSSGDSSVLRAGIPPKAQRVQEGSGQLVYTPDQPGRVFLYNASDDRVVGRYQMRKGQRFAVDAAAGRATVDGNEVSIGELSKNATYRVFFLPDNAG